MMSIARFLLIAVILAVTACSSGDEPTVQLSPAATENPGAPTVALTTQPSPVAEQPTAPSTVPTAQPSPVAENPTTTVQPASNGLCQNPYYPVVQGASWQYQMSGASSGTFVRSITGVREDGFDYQDVLGAGVTLQGSWECREGNFISLMPGSGVSFAASDVQANLTIESNTGFTFPADPRPGMEWTQIAIFRGQQTVGDTNMESRNVLNLSCKAIGIENVSVPAGDFETLRVDCLTKVDISISGVPAFSTTDTTTSWYAREVGWVKSRSSSDTGVTEIVLLSYTIP